MQDFTTYETSLKLREAGFPQPPHEFGQVWWLERANGEVYPDVLPLGFEFDPAQNPVFAPRVTDILMHLATQHSIMRFSHYDEKFTISSIRGSRYWNENPAECGAMLYLKEKQQ